MTLNNVVKYVEVKENFVIVLRVVLHVFIGTLANSMPRATAEAYVGEALSKTPGLRKLTPEHRLEAWKVCQEVLDIAYGGDGQMPFGHA